MLYFVQLGQFFSEGWQYPRHKEHFGLVRQNVELSSLQARLTVSKFKLTHESKANMPEVEVQVPSEAILQPV